MSPVETGRASTLAEGEAHVYFLDPDEGFSDLALAKRETWLDDVELEYLSRVTHARRRREFLLARVLLRKTLSRYRGSDPRDWRFVTNEHGRPELELEDSIRFNVSHTDGLIACAVAEGCDVGVDVEDTHRRGRTVALADRYFSRPEVTALRALDESLQRDRFFDLWTLKESYIKARGLGLAVPLQKFSFELDAGPSVGFSTDPDLSDDADSWRFVLSRPTPRHRAAIALRCGSTALSVDESWLSAGDV